MLLKWINVPNVHTDGLLLPYQIISIHKKCFEAKIQTYLFRDVSDAMLTIYAAIKTKWGGCLTTGW